MGGERFDVYAWRDGEDRGEPREIFLTEREAAEFRSKLSRLPRREKPNFIEIIYRPSGRTVSYTSDHWGGSDEDSPSEPDLTFDAVSSGLKIAGAIGPGGFR